MTTGQKISSEIEGVSILGGGRGERSDRIFNAFDPRNGTKLEPQFYSAHKDEVEKAATLANAAKQGFADLSNKRRAGFLSAIAENLEAVRSEITQRASAETGLPVARFEGELGRTCGQIRMFADVVADGSWVDARIDRAIPDREPLPRPDIRSMLRPIGPVAVFCASNFPLAFSVAGGDTASALAAGCPVVVIANAAHPGTAELAGKAIANAISEMGLDEGIFSLIFAKDYEAGQKLVGHPLIKAVGFTGSRKGGRALTEIAVARTEPIPVFAEMSSVNPVFVLPEALAERGDAIANGLFGSFTLGFGQFCTKPGLVFVPEGEAASDFAEKLKQQVEQSDYVPLLTSGIREAFVKNSGRRGESARSSGEPSDGFDVPVGFATASSTDFLTNPALADEIFGPTTLLVTTKTADEFRTIAESLEGQLTATIHGNENELAENSDLVSILEEKAGRLVFNGFPTGVEVCGSMVHGGPFPATNDPRTTSVGKRAIERFTRLIAFQDFPDEMLPDPLKDANPCNISRLEE